MKFERQISQYISGQSLNSELDEACFEFLDHERLLPLICSINPTIFTSEKLELLQAENRRAIAEELARTRVIKGVLSALAKAGIECLLFKGTPLAYQVYQEPWHRSRTDTDVLIRTDDKEIVHELLIDLGYRTENAIDGQLVASERAYYLTDEVGLTHVLDVHWQLNNSWMLSSACDFEELWSERKYIEQLEANAVSLRHALYIACVHRIAHLNDVAYRIHDETHYESDYLLWFYDIHLLAAEMREPDWQWLAHTAGSRKMGSFVLDGVKRSVELFGTDVPSFLFTELGSLSDQYQIEYLKGGRLRGELAAFRSLPGWKARLRLLSEHLFPSREYMRNKYGSKSFLPFCYARRIIGGIARRFLPTH